MKGTRSRSSGSRRQATRQPAPNYHIIGGATMAKKVEGYIKLQIPAGKATPAPPVGPALGQHGVNIVEFTKAVQRKNSR